MIETTAREQIFSEPAPSVYPHILFFFFLLINTLLVWLLSVSLWELISMKLTDHGLSWPGGWHWPWSLLAWGLGFGAQLQEPNFSLWNRASSHCRPRLSSVQFSRSVMSDSLRPHESQHARPPCPTPTPGVHPDARPCSQWCHPAISSSVVPFPPARNPSQHQSLFQWVNSSHEVAKGLEFQL